MIKEEDPRFRHLDKKVGFFITAAIAGLIIAVILIGFEKDLFTQKYSLKFIVENGTGFSRGMSVKLSGFRIGRIKAISLNKQARIEIDIQIDKEYQQWIKKDSVVKLVKEGLVGDSIIDVSVGSQTAEILKDGAYITYVKSKGLEEIANNIADKVTPVLIEVKEIISYINDPEGDIKQSLTNIRELTSELKSTRLKVDSLLAESQKNLGTISNETVFLLRSTNDKINTAGPVIEKLDRTMADVEQKLPPLLDRIGSTMDHLDKTSHNLEVSADKAFPKIPSLLNSTEDMILETDKVMKSLGNTWPLRSNVPTPKIREFVPGDSNE
jgi:phospholipid/cholesterol/gamma-HCH transport system substrate-binding protein